MRKTAKTVNDIIEKFGMIFLVLMLLIVSMQVITRLTIKTTPRWAEEVAAILMVWFAFIGISIGVYEGIHIAITYFTDLLPVKFRKVILIIDELLIMFYGGSLFYFGSRLVYATRTSTLPATQWPAFMPYLMSPLAGLVVVLFAIINIMNIVQNRNTEGMEG